MDGQFAAGNWTYAGARSSFYREVCGLTLPEGLWAHALALEQTMQSACLWYAHRDFVMVCEHPREIYLELADPGVPRGHGSHRLHRTDGPAISWPDGWDIHAIHGKRVVS
jgi:hypothetical protein